MLENLDIFQMSSALARHAATRHRVVSENVANADTPGFRARDVKNFSEYVNNPFPVKATRAGHAGDAPLVNAAMRTEIVADPDAKPAPNGNSVALDQQTLKSVETRAQHALALGIYSKSMSLLRISLGRAG